LRAIGTFMRRLEQFAQFSDPEVGPVKTIGVLGGIGPQATMDFERRLHRVAQRLLPQRGNTGYPPMVVHYHRRPPFVMGEMLACVRQQAAPVRVPRSVAENERAVAAAVDRLTLAHGRSPTVAEIAEQAKLHEEAVLDALRASMAARPVSLDEIEPERFGETDETLEAVERRLELGSRLDRLDRRSRAVLVLRFGMELSQREIAERLGISQMHVSRLLRAAMSDIADQGEDDATSG
jgi:RNA polymerase sigma factor (sigma-70 family)